MTRIHAFAGKSYVRVYHTITYTGVPDKSRPLPGEHPAVATGLGPMVDEEARLLDAGMTQPNDRIHSIGMNLDYQLGENRSFSTGYYDGAWYNPGTEQVHTSSLDASAKTSVLQSGPEPTRIPPIQTSTPDERMGGFFAQVQVGEAKNLEVERAAGWVDVNDGQRGVTVGIRNFIEEFPKEIEVDPATGVVTAYLWSPKAGPMSFQRMNQNRDGDMVGNFATGMTKTSEMVYHFYDQVPDESARKLAMNVALNPPNAHVAPSWYANSGAFGNFAPANDRFAAFERGLSYKFDWLLFNQQWEPWYGMFYHGDMMTNFYREDWNMWGVNEPAQDFMWWMQYMRTGDRKYYLQAQNMSRFSMDVGNIHWPVKPPFRGDTNLTIDWFEYEAAPESSPYVGMGRRHGNQPWVSVLSAHVWTPGWVASYYLDGYHRGLDIAKLTADHYLRRVWGEHDFRGRRLYLGMFNLMPVYDATKEQKYLDEFEYRMNIAMDLQNEQGWSLNIDRYGYSQNYFAHSMMQYYQLTGNEDVKQSLIRHARRVIAVKPMDHDMESYLTSIYSLVAAYELSGEKLFLDTAKERAEYLKTNSMEYTVDINSTQRAYSEALEAVSNLPKFPEGGSIHSLGHVRYGRLPTDSASSVGHTHTTYRG